MSEPTILEKAIDAFRSGDLDGARSLAERADPSPKLDHLLGLIDCRNGHFDSGVERLGKAFEGEPDNIGFRVMFARALVDGGRASEAVDVATPPPGISPPELALWQVRGEATLAAGELAKAAEAWRVIAGAKPQDWRAWANQGEALARLEHWSDSADAFQRAVALNPEEQTLRDNCAAALVRSGRYEEAADHLERLLDAGSEDVTARLTLARVLAELGRHGDSMRQLKKAAQAIPGDRDPEGDTGLIAIALGPDDEPGRELSESQVRGIRELALLLERTNRMEALRNLIRDSASRDIPVERLAYPAAALVLRDGHAAEAKRLIGMEDVEGDEILRYRLKAKIADQLGDPAAAFEAAEAMNRSARDYESWLARGSKLRRQLWNYAERITPEWADRILPLEPGKRRSPAFLVGFPRSGTTLLDTFLRGHPQVEVLEELEMLRAAEAVLGNGGQLPYRSQLELKRARDAYFAELDRNIDPAFEGLVVDKLPLNMVGVAMIHALFPDARIIFAQRHPCDCVLSGFMQGFKLNDAMACFLTIEGAADLYDAAMTAFTRSRDLLPASTHTLVYEDLVEEPEEVLQPLIGFLSLDWTPELLDHRSTAKARGAINTPSYDQVVQPLNKSATGRWKRYEAQLAPVLPVLLPWAERLGYRD
jgi:tetratricopeptide (TPR) repeat protein